MNRFKKVLITVAALAALALGGSALAGAASGGDGDGEANDDGAHGLSAQTVAHIESAALKETGGGTVNQVEADTENGATYEAEVRKPDGSQVDVRLDGAFKTVVVETDHED